MPQDSSDYCNIIDALLQTGASWHKVTLIRNIAPEMIFGDSPVEVALVLSGGVLLFEAFVWDTQSRNISEDHFGKYR